MTLGHFAPAGATGVAAYARALHRALAAWGTIEWNRQDADLPVYHIGNNPLHAEMLTRALGRPGLTILHDAVLHHFYLSRGREAYCDEFVYNYGEWHRGTAERLWANRSAAPGEETYFAFPMLRRVAESARLVVVHNPRAAQRVREAAPGAQVAIIPHLAEASSVDGHWLGPGVWFGVFGYLRPAKRVAQIIRAALRVPRARLLIAGACLSPEMDRSIEQYAQVQRLPLGSERELAQRLQSVDVVVSLRSPSAGETSGITIRAMAAAKPVLLHSPGEAEDFPEGLCGPVETGVAESASLEAMMHWMTQSAANREAMGQAAAAYVRQEHAPARVAEMLWGLARSLCLMLIFVLAAGAAVPEAIQVPMRDGVKLAAHLYRPDTKGRFPILLLRTPYGRTAQLTPNQESLLHRGFAVVLQNVRGRYGSEGVFDPLRQGFDDAEDTLRWLERQPWSNGRIGMFGGSYSGLAQWKAAATKAPALKAIFPVHSGIDDYFDRYYSRGGAFRLGHRILWLAQNLAAPGFTPPSFDRYVRHVPLRTMDTVAAGQPLSLLRRVLDHPAYDAFWSEMSVAERLDPAQSPPAFIVSGWYDPNVEGDLDWFSRLAAAKPAAHRIVVGPWAHNMSTPFPNVDFGPRSRYPVLRAQHQWFDAHVKGEGATPAGGPVSLFVMGANVWREESEWPLNRAVATKFFLRAGRRLSATPDREWKETWRYDPRDPVPTLGGATCCDPAIFPWGPKDQRPLESRADVLTFSSAPLTQDIEITGPIRALLHVQTTAPDTDFTVKLLDIFPSGEARNLCDGILRLRYRRGLNTPILSQPGEHHAIMVDAGVTSNVFREGHRIGVEISSSNFPKYDRNPNTGRAIADEAQTITATQSLWLGGRRASHLILPVVPRPATIAPPVRTETKRTSAASHPKPARSLARVNLESTAR